MGNSLSRRSTPPDEGRLNYDDKPIHAPAVSGPKKTTSITFPPTPVDAVPAILAEARRKAQNAVLNLLPHGVGFDDFILEGIDEQVVTSVFEAVGASIKKKQATQPAKSAKPAPAATSLPKDVPTGPKSMKWASKADSAINATIPKPGEVTVSPAVPSFGSAPLVVPRRASSSSLAKPATTAVTEKQPVTPIESRKGGATSDAAAKKGEERKDRIARLLEAKNKKAEKPSPPAKSAPAVKPVETVQSSVPKEATKSDASKEAPPVPEVAEPAPPEPTAMELDTAKPDETPQSVLTPVEAPAEVTKVDKSELLKQKMKALLKERQEKAAADAASAKTNEMSSFQRSRSESPAYNFSYSPNAPQYQASFNSAGAPPIPGLFLSQSNFPQFQPPFEQFAPYQFTQDATQQDIMQQEAVQPLPPPPPAQNPEIVNTRKRRVASDFNDFAPPEAPPAYKRPFGYSQPSPVFLEVSDDEDEADDEDDAMDVDDENDMMDVDESSINPFSAPSNLRGTTKSLRDSQPLSDTKKPYKPASGVGTPSVIPGFGRPSARAEDLKAKELQIEEMRRKIAEAEQRSKLKQSTGESQQPTPTIDRSATSSIDKSSQIDRHLSKVNQNIASSSQRLDRAQEVTYVVSALPLAPGAVPFVHRPPTPNAEHIALREDVRKLRGKMTAAMADLRQKGKAKNELKSELIELNAAADAELAKQGITLRALNDANARAGRGGRGTFPRRGNSCYSFWRSY